MSLLNDLYETYNSNLELVGKKTLKGIKEIELLPIGHDYTNMQIEVTVTPQGEFLDAKVIPKEKAATRIPMTEASSSRTSSPVPHPLHDGLKYVAGDYERYVTEKQKQPTPHERYMIQLNAWCHSEYANSRVQAILSYLEKGTLITDLIQRKILFAQNGLLTAKYPKELAEVQEKPEIFSVVPSEQYRAFVRFDVQDPSKLEQSIPVWEDAQVMNSAIHFFTENGGTQILDFVTGEKTVRAESHPSNIRYGGDMAKLISANDKKNFTYLGRFLTKDQVATVGYETSQKAHNALKWLIVKQGIIKDGRLYLVWSNTSAPIPTPMMGADELLFTIDSDLESIESPETTNSYFAEQFKRALTGFRQQLTPRMKVNVLILDAATPGRMAVLYYNSFSGQDYFERLKQWQINSEWKHQYVFKGQQRQVFYGAPNIFDIVSASLGEHASEKIVKNYLQTLFTCIVEGRRVPWYICRNLVIRSSNPKSFSSNAQWLKNISITCSIVKNYYGEDLHVEVNQNEKDRSYLYGQLLGVAHALELKALQGDARSTNAQKYMAAFRMHPEKTWRIIFEKLMPYIQKLGPKSLYYQKLIQQISAELSQIPLTDKPLNGKYIMGFNSQLNQIYTKKEEDE